MTIFLSDYECDVTEPHLFYGTSHIDIDSTLPLEEGQVLAVNELGKFAPVYAMMFAGDWGANTYYPNQVVMDDGWQMIALNVTNDKAAPYPIGEAVYLYDGTLTTTSITAKQVIFGTRYTVDQGGYTLGYIIDTVIDNRYQVFLVTDPLGNKVTTLLFDFIATQTGGTEFATNKRIILAGTIFDILAITNEPDATPTVWSGNWEYVTPNNITPVANGQISHANKQLDVLDIATEDADGIDQRSKLVALNIGDIIEGAGVRWAIQQILDNGTYFSFAISPATQGSPTGIQAFNFETVTATPITYGFDTDYWLGDSNQGLFIADGDYNDIVPNDNAYGIDVKVQSAQVSQNWKALSAP